MRLHTVAAKHDTVKAKDANGTATIKCQLAPLELFKIDGVAVKKRQLSTAPDVVMPARGVLNIDGDNYLVGTGTPDYWRGTKIRMNYVIQGTDGIASLQSVAAALRGDAPVSAHAALLFSRYLPESADSSKYPPQYQVFLAGTEASPADSLIYMAGDWYLVKESYLSNSGLRIAMANVVNGTVFETISYEAKTYVPVSDTMVTVTTPVKVMRVKWQEHFHYMTRADETYQRGDIQVLVLKSAMPTAKASDELPMSDGPWRVLSVQDEGEILSMHLRRA